MMPQQLWATTLDPKQRMALKITVDNPEQTSRMLDELMGKDPSTRKRFIMERAGEAQTLDL
jgi:DNA gyrase subunit B/topoisomerase-4 subunit B